MAKSVKVHDDTHRALMEIKSRRRSRSVDEVVREMIRLATEVPVEKYSKRGASMQLTSFTKS